MRNLNISKRNIYWCNQLVTSKCIKGFDDTFNIIPRIDK